LIALSKENDQPFTFDFALESLDRPGRRSVAETPALRVERFESRRQTEYALDEAAIQEFDCHEASEESIFKSGYFGKGLNQTG